MNWSGNFHAWNSIGSECVASAVLISFKWCCSKLSLRSRIPPCPVVSLDWCVAAVSVVSRCVTFCLSTLRKPFVAVPLHCSMISAVGRATLIVYAIRPR